MKRSYGGGLLVEVKRLVTVVTSAILLAGLILFGLSDTSISVADTSIPDNEVTSNRDSILGCYIFEECDWLHILAVCSILL